MNFIDRNFYIIVYFVIGFFITPGTAVSDILFPYQNCDSSSLNYSSRIARELDEFLYKYGLKQEVLTEQTVKKDREPVFPIYGEGNTVETVNEEADFYPVNSSVPQECFLAVALAEILTFPDEHYSYCSRTTDFHPRSHLKFCINEDYVETIWTAFEDMSRCFNYDEKRQVDIFHLINRESKWILNSRSSPSGPMCFGQLTEDNIKTINNHIFSRASSKPLPYSEIYDEVIGRCPFLEDKVIENEHFLTCRTTHDPYVCLFYTFFDLERNYRMIKDKLNQNFNYMGDRGKFSLVKQQIFKLPIKLNEMLVVQGSFQDREVNWLFWDDSEVYDALNKFPDEEIIRLQADKVPLFENQEEIELIFNYWTHNGGETISDPHMVEMINQLKISLASCSPESKEEICRLREIVQTGKGLAVKDIQAIFEESLLEHYGGSKKRKKEVAYYIQNVVEKNEDVFSYQEGTEQTNTMLSYYKEAVRYTSRDLYLSDEEAVNFQQHISEVCPRL